MSEVWVRCSDKRVKFDVMEGCREEDYLYYCVYQIMLQSCLAMVMYNIDIMMALYGGKRVPRNGDSEAGDIVYANFYQFNLYYFKICDCTSLIVYVFE